MVKTVARSVTAFSLIALLAGCSTFGGSGSAQSTPSPTSPAAGTATAAAAPAPEGAVIQGVCPQVSLRDGTAFYRTYSKPGSKSDADVVFQATLANTTRACTQSPTSMTIKVQAQGRLIAGPMGHAGTLSMPIRVAVVNGDQVIASELVPFSATLPSADQPTQFLFTKDVTIPANPAPTTQVYVGFDDGPAPAKHVEKRRKK
ncbi:hypothetical protein NAC44_19340 [Allorhizobium sp. BGMRC 0089]|uniref:hypothetical protein n=1 Tax=Allorhizobium sonneratiae TaxID=2934936 RepID=UPI002033693F|nr:hypothetical protein [Allorhizobium sonneratiae]MCM2294485.1 hypothetical protein [Allorhizobium sonneratiae]